ncbi:MAG: hypothetical protein LBG68_03855 [Coriobacteriales bacterium]|jgi:hypothetical protein|nr:hypothetical protein [Coriobacteriales bacterium]
MRVGRGVRVVSGWGEGCCGMRDAGGAGWSWGVMRRCRVVRVVRGGAGGARWAGVARGAARHKKTRSAILGCRVSTSQRQVAILRSACQAATGSTGYYASDTYYYDGNY